MYAPLTMNPDLSIMSVTTFFGSVEPTLGPSKNSKRTNGSAGSEFGSDIATTQFGSIDVRRLFLRFHHHLSSLHTKSHSSSRHHIQNVCGKRGGIRGPSGKVRPLQDSHHRARERRQDNHPPEDLQLHGRTRDL